MTAPRDVDGRAGDDEREVVRLHHPARIGDIGRAAVPRRQGQPRDLGAAAGCPGIGRHECRPTIEEPAQGRTIAEQERVFEQRFELFRGLRAVAHVPSRDGVLAGRLSVLAVQSRW